VTKEKKTVIHQPDFLSYLGFFHRLLYSDCFVLLDNVQFVSGTSRSWMNRDKIKTKDGEKWLTVAVQKHAREIKINEVLLSDSVDWRKQNLNLITQNYRKAPFYEEIFPHIEELYSFQGEKLIDFNVKSILLLLNLFDIQLEIIYASSLNPAGKNNLLLVDILNKINSKVYISGFGARDYFDPLPFDKAGIEVIWQDFKHPVYPQLYENFIPFLSSIDLLFNCGKDESRKILRSCPKI
jgi:hypothetical protein